MSEHITLDTTDEITEADFVSVRWEPCTGFVGEADDSQVCGDCGWLHDDHRSDAVVHRLPARPVRAMLPRRLAS